MGTNNILQPGLVSAKKGPTTFACKSQECRLAGLVYFPLGLMEYFQSPLIYFNPHCPLIDQVLKNFQYIQLRATPYFILRGRGGRMETKNKNMWAWFRKK